MACILDENIYHLQRCGISARGQGGNGSVDEPHSAVSPRVLPEAAFSLYHEHSSVIFFPQRVPAMTDHHFHSLNYSSATPGPRLILLGAVHGNEVCGAIALRRLQAALEQGHIRLLRGSLTLVPVSNPLAFARGQRCGDRNLNRNLYPTATPRDFEDHIANWLCPLLAQHDAVLDLHSFHTAGEAFCMLGPQDNAGVLEPFAHARAEERLARSLGVRRFVDGWLDTYARGVERRRHALQGGAFEQDARYGVGTTEYLRSVGGYGLTLECGQHDDAAAPELAWRAALNALACLGLIDAPPPALLPAAQAEMLRLFDVVDKLHADDRFVREWASFDVIPAGHVIGLRHNGSVLRAECDARIVFPNPGASAGQEWFYLAREVQRFD